MTDPTFHNKREDTLPNVVLDTYSSLDNNSAQEAPKEAVETGSNPPQEPGAEMKEGEPIPLSPPVTSDESDSERENNRTKKRVNMSGHNEDTEQGAKVRGHVDLEANVNGNVDISVTLNINKFPLQNLRIHRCHYFK